MKKKLFSVFTWLLAITLLTVALPAQKALAVANVTARLRPDVTIVIDGEKSVFYNVSGRQVHPVLYNGTTYLPVRAIGELMGMNVDWNGRTKTVTIAGERTTPPTRGTPDTAPSAADIQASLRDDFTVVVNGYKRTFRDVTGRTVYPLLYQGSNYLPVRAIGELMGKDVGWDGATNTVTLTGGGEDDDLVTDADSFSGNTNPPAPTPTPGTGTSSLAISRDKAQEIALRRVPGAAARHITKLKLDCEHGCWIYDVELYYNWAEYELEIDASSGKILSYSCEHCDYGCDDHDHGHYNTGDHHTGSHHGSHC